MRAKSGIRSATWLTAGSLVVAAALAAGAAPGRQPTPQKAAQQGTACSSCVEKRPVLEPGRFANAKIYEPEVVPAYKVAQRIPATLDRLHCFCECAENTQLRHKTLLTCFTDEHAAGCGICTREALMADDLKRKGASDDEIVVTVESVFRTEGHPPTHGAKH